MKRIIDLRFFTVGKEWDNHLSRKNHSDILVADGKELNCDFIWDGTEYGRQQTLWSISDMLKGVKTLEITSEGCDSYGENEYCNKVVIDYKKSYDYTIQNIVKENKLKNIATEFLNKKGISNPYEIIFNKKLEVVAYATSKPDYFLGQETNYLACDQFIKISDSDRIAEVKYFKTGSSAVYLYGITR